MVASGRLSSRLGREVRGGDWYSPIGVQDGVFLESGSVYDGARSLFNFDLLNFDLLIHIAFFFFFFRWNLVYTWYRTSLLCGFPFLNITTLLICCKNGKMSQLYPMITRLPHSNPHVRSWHREWETARAIQEQDKGENQKHRRFIHDVNVNVTVNADN